MKIAVVSIGSFDTQYSDYHIMRDIILGLLEKGNQVLLIQKQYFDIPKYPKQLESYLGNQLQVENIRFERKAKADLKARYLADFFYYRKACHIMRRNKPDKIFLQSNNTAFYPIFYAKHILKIPVLYNEQDIFPENAFFAGILSEKTMIYRIAYRLQKYAYDNATALSTISEDMKDTIVRKYHISPDKVAVIHNWGHEDLSAHSESENVFLKKYPKKAGEFRVVYAGNLGKMQNVELVLKSAKYMKQKQDITFYIVGTGANEQQLKKYASKEELYNVIFVGMQPPEEVADLYRAADINIIPLQKGLVFAALPSKTADCLMAKRPIITCVDTESKFADVMTKYGYQNCSPESPQELAGLIENLREKEGTMQPVRLWKNLFSKNKNVEKHVQLMEYMADKH